MLNRYKKIHLEIFSSKTDSFWKAPFPSGSRFHISPKSNSNFLGGLPIVLGQQELPQKRWWKQKRKQVKRLKLHFFFSTVVFNSIFLFKKFPKTKKIKSGTLELKKKMLFLNNIFCKKKRYKGYPLRSNKGGYISSNLGFRSFMPKSHSKRFLGNKAPIEWLIGLRTSRRRKRFSPYKKRIHVSIISSSKPQKKSVRLKRGGNVRGQGYFWRKAARSINKRVIK